MGIPMYREPSSTEAAKNNHIKDPCAAARSAIRRQATIRRPSRYSGSSALRSATLRPPFSRPLADEIERETNGLHRHVRSPIPNTGSDDPFDLTSGLGDAGQRLLNDVLRQSRPGQRLRIPRNPMLPQMYRRSSPGADGANRQDPEPPMFTPRFTPTALPSNSAYQTSPEDVRLFPFLQPEHIGRNPIGSTIPLLRRVGQRSINEATTNRESAVDGLGDRQRSMSPDDDQGTDAWATLLTTITPDATLPSADSSFTSASAAGTNASRNGTSRSSATSFGTVLGSLDVNPATVQVALDPNPEFLNPCDYPTSSDSDSDSDGEINRHSLFRRYRRRMRQLDQARRPHNIQSSMSSNLPSVPTISIAVPEPSIDPDLHQMQAILDRLARREDIPDDWWAAAGLSRTIGQRVGVNDEPNNTDGIDGPLRQP